MVSARNDRPNVSGNATLSDPGPNQWFNTAAFSMPAYGTFGNAGRNILEGPGYQNVNLALLKRVALRGRTSLQLRAEAFNLLNRTNFDLPDNFYGSPTFGQVLSAGAPRHIQFGVRLRSKADLQARPTSSQRSARGHDRTRS